MKHGPGKFETCGNYALVSAYVSENCDDDIGDCQELGWYGKFSGKIKNKGPFYAIASEDSQGFVDVEWFDSATELENAWSEIVEEYEELNAETEE